MKYYLLLVLLTIGCLQAHSQKHPLSKSDSGIIIQSLERYDDFLIRKDLRGASGALNATAFVFWNNNHFEKAAEYYEKSLALNEQVANENGIAMINNNLGMLYADLGRYDEALSHFTRTLAARKANKEPVGVISALINLSVVLNNLKDYEKSVEHLLEALDLAREIYDKKQMRSAYGMLSETYEKMGNVEKSLQYFQLYKSFHEEIQREKVNTINQQLAEEQTQKEILRAEKAIKENELLKKQLELYQKDSINQSLYSNLSRKEVEIELLEKDRKVRVLETKAQAIENKKLQNEQAYLRNTIIIILVSIMLIGSLLFVGVIRSRRHTKELQKKNTSIEEQKKELEEANEAKDRMFSIISHDLRSPISSLQGLFGLIDDIEMSGQLRRALDSVEGQLTNSAGLLENLLTWSKTQISNTEPKHEEIQLTNLVDDVFRLFQPNAASKGIELRSSVKDVDLVYSDRAIVEITLRNIVQNAIKFTKEGGSVTVAFSQNELESILSITDTGVGIKPEKVATLFDISTNRSSMGTQNEKGSGLGLILCKQLIERAGSFIEVSSEYGNGTALLLKFRNFK